GFQAGDIGPIGVAIGIGKNFEDAENIVNPWINAEIQAGNATFGDVWAVSGKISGGRVMIAGLINGSKAPLSDRYFNNASRAATNALSNIQSVTPQVNFTFEIAQGK